MIASLNYDSKDPKYILLGKILNFTKSKRSLNALSRAGIKNRLEFVKSMKIIFTSMFFSCTISHVVNELNRSGKLRKFMGFKDEIPTIDQVYEILSRYSAEEYCKYANTILNIFNKKNKNSYNTYIVDATPSACDFNIDKKFIKNEHLDKL